MNVIVVSAPLVTKGGVFRTTCELIEAAKAEGLSWSGLIVTRGDLAVRELPGGVDLRILKRGGIRGLADLRRILLSHRQLNEADAVISLIPQTDVLLGTLRRPRNQIRIAYVRGAAWPQRGEAHEIRRSVWRLIERQALRRMNEVWVTTPILRDEIEWPSAHIVPAGIASVAGTDRPLTKGANELTWAARMSVDKNPGLFLDILREVDAVGTMFGDGELRTSLEHQAPPNVQFRGWAEPSSLWGSTMIYFGTSNREAFGRSAVEAACLGIPVILSDSFGAAPLLYTDPELRRRFVLHPNDTQRWVAATTSLIEDEDLRQAIGQHISTNAKRLTIEASVAACSLRLRGI